MLKYGNNVLSDRGRVITEWIIYLVIGILLAALFTIFIWSERKISRTAASGQLQTMSVKLENVLLQRFRSARDVLENTRQAVLDRSCTASCRQWLLQSMRQTLPGVRAILVQDTAQHIIDLSGHGNPSALLSAVRLNNVAALPTSEQMHIELQDKLGPQANWIALSLPMTSRDSDKMGHIILLLDAANCKESLFSALDTDEIQASIRDEHDQTFLSTSERTDFPSYATSPHEHKMRLEYDSSKRGYMVIKYVTASREVGLDTTLTIHLWRSLASVDRYWKAAAIVLMMTWMLLSILGAFMLHWVQRRRRMMLDQARQHLVERTDIAERMELALSSADVGLWDYDLVNDCGIFDARSNAMLRYPAGFQLSAAGQWRALIRPEHMATFERSLRFHLQDPGKPFEAEVQMLHQQGHWVWIQCRGKIVARDAAGVPLRMVGTRMDVTPRRRAQNAVERLAFYDSLTQLPNRRLLMQRLDQALDCYRSHREHGAVIFVDLDNFKMLNDTRGHDVGDSLLKQVAQRLTHSVRDHDTVARLGGDEFVVLLADLGDDARQAELHTLQCCAKILKSLNMAFKVEGHDFTTTASLGAVLLGSETDTINELLRRADVAMYQAKAAGRNTCRLFRPFMQAALDESASLEDDLRHALGRAQLVLHYQPLVDSRGEMIGAEALMRWLHPQRGLLLPDDFISLAERTGLIVELGQWALLSACEQLVRWSAHPQTARLSIAVNVSAKQFHQPDFTQCVAEILERTGASPSHLIIELTESTMIGELDELIAKMSLLRQSGILLALDDFGTGYSSLSYLSKLPLDKVKIDRSFVQEMHQSTQALTIVETILKLGDSMGMEIIAEGVETTEQWLTLRDMGCAAYQGYLFGKAQPIEAITTARLTISSSPGASPHLGSAMTLEAT